MTDHAEDQASPLRPAALVVVEALPSVQGGVSALASAHAPFVYFDGVPFCGAGEGLAELTLVARRLVSRTSDGVVATDHVVVAHLRCGLRALKDLRHAIDNALLLAQPTAGEGSN